MSFEVGYSYVYIWWNSIKDKFYIGVHECVKKYDNYRYSSKDIDLIEAYNLGQLNRILVLRVKNSQKQKAYALERHLIKFARENGIMLYNQSGGGGHRGGADPKILSEKDYKMGEAVLLDPRNYSHIDDKFDSTEETARQIDYVREVAVQVRDAVKVYWKNKEDPSVEVLRQVYWLDFDDVRSIDILQIRDEAIDAEHAKDVCDSMISTNEKEPGSHLVKIEPITIIVGVNSKGEFGDNFKCRADGVHTFQGAETSKLFKKIPVVYIHISEFFNDFSFVPSYGTYRNEREKSTKSNNKNDCRKAIYDFAKTTKLDIHSDEFHQQFSLRYRGTWRSNSITKVLNNVRKELNESLIRGENWIDYSADDFKKAKNIVQTKLLSLLKNPMVTNSSVNQLENMAIGACMNLFANSARGKKSVLILAYHTNSSTEEKASFYENQMRNGLYEAGFELQPEKAVNGFKPYVSKITGKSIFYALLPCRYDLNQKGKIEDIIYQQMINE
jgi:hypothetical protein